MKFGIFLAPFHEVDENPTLALERDFQLIEHLDKLGYDEAWIGEHHSGGLELIASPELFIAAAALRTSNIRLGTGVSSVPYHHPLVLTDRMIQLDHQTRGRAMFGIGAGALPSDAHMMGIDPLVIRERMQEALDDIIALMQGEVVTNKTDWYVLQDGRIQLPPYTKPNMEMAVASVVSPSGALTAGKHGLGLLSVAATAKAGFEALASNWKIYSDTAAEHGHQADRDRWRLVGPVHIAETREKAHENVRFGLQRWIQYFNKVGALPLTTTGEGDLSDDIEEMVESGLAVIGTPDDLIAQLERLEKATGGFGVFLDFAHNWADFEATKRSYELIARYVMPRFQKQNEWRTAAMAWAAKNRSEFISKRNDAVQKEFDKLKNADVGQNP
jgi:limonene 1,2-monooxygenase